MVTYTSPTSYFYRNLRESGMPKRTARYVAQLETNFKPDILHVPSIEFMLTEPERILVAADTMLGKNEFVTVIQEEGEGWKIAALHIPDEELGPVAKEFGDYLLVATGLFPEFVRRVGGTVSHYMERGAFAYSIAAKHLPESTERLVIQGLSRAFPEARRAVMCSTVPSIDALFT